MIRIDTHRGVLHFPTTTQEAVKLSTEELRSVLIQNDPNGEWWNEGEDGPTREEMIEQIVVFGQEAFADEREAALRKRFLAMDRETLLDIALALALQVEICRSLATIDGSDDPVREARERGEECENVMQALLEAE